LCIVAIIREWGYYCAMDYDQLADSGKEIFVAVRFRIHGALRFLSHAEGLRLFQRACRRAGLNVKHSKGFNPRPKLSLPLPRSVGVEVDNDLLCFRVLCFGREDSDLTSEDVSSSLSGQLPAGCELVSVDVSDVKETFLPVEATYVLPVKKQYLGEGLKQRIEHLLASESIITQRRAKGRVSAVKKVNVRGFVKSICLDGETVVVVCGITQSGSVRVDEILNMLELDAEKLALPVRRTDIRWRAA